MAGFYSVSRSSCVCTLVTLPTCSIWSAFASLRGIFNNEHGSLAVAHIGREGGNAPPLSQVSGMWHDAEAFMFFHRADCYSARSLYLPGCLSSVAEPPLVGLTFGLRSGLAPLLRSRSSRRTRLAPCCDSISGDTLTPRYADLFIRAFHFSQSQSLRDRDLHPACVLRLSRRHQVMLMLVLFVLGHSYRDYTE